MLHRCSSLQLEKNGVFLGSCPFSFFNVGAGLLTSIAKWDGGMTEEPCWNGTLLGLDSHERLACTCDCMRGGVRGWVCAGGGSILAVGMLLLFPWSSFLSLRAHTQRRRNLHKSFARWLCSEGLVRVCEQSANAL